MTVHDGYIFICDCAEEFRSACSREIFYKEHDGKQYCVLHYPGTEKKEDFKKVLQRKLDDEDYDFRGVWFPDYVSFKGFIFSTDVSLKHAHFNASADFSHAQFKAHTDFAGTWFSEDANFHSTQFIGVADFGLDVFNDTQFCMTANFSEAQFHRTAHFKHIVFVGEANFREAQFDADVEFQLIVFCADVYFIDTKFMGRAEFGGTNFNAGAYFETQFNGRTDFSHSSFSDDAYFSGARFSQYTTFFGVRFRKEVDFSYSIRTLLSAQFKGEVHFENVEFNGEADFSYSVFYKNVYFRRTKFIKFNENAYAEIRKLIREDDSSSESEHGNNKPITLDDEDAEETQINHISFLGTKFKDGVSFEENEFTDQALLNFASAIFVKPGRATFHTVALRPHWFINIDSRRFNFINVDWGLLDKHDALHREIIPLVHNEVNNAPGLLAIAFRQLAVNAEENNRYEEAASFRYLAMNTKRLTQGRIIDPFSLSWWYWALSGYGERVLRAFVALAVIWLIFAFIYWSGDATWWQPKQSTKLAAESNAQERQPTIAVAPLSFPEALVHSVGVMTLQKPEPLPANKRAKTFVLFETILGPLQAALLALAIRRKFMR